MACADPDTNYQASPQQAKDISVVHQKVSLTEYQKLQIWDPVYFGQLPKSKYDQMQKFSEEIQLGDAKMNNHCDLLSLQQNLKHADIPKFLAKKTPLNILKKYHKSNIKKKKTTFLCHIIPAAIVANFNTIRERAKVFKLFQDFENNKRELENYAIGYGIKSEKIESLLQNKEDLQEELSKRILPIPMSLILAQASEESGWGMGRLANACTNYFSLYATGSEVVPPDCIARGAPNRKLKKYDSILDNTSGYLMRLNGSISFYQDFREARMEMIKNKKFDGAALAGNLKEYAENPNYEGKLKRHIKTNNLKKWDKIFSFDKQTLPQINTLKP